MTPLRTFDVDAAIRRAGCAAIAALLLASGPSLATTDAQLATNARLLVSVRNEDAAGVGRALHDGAVVDSRNRVGETSLLVALKKNRADIAQALLDAGANVNIPAVNGVTPLMAAAYAGQAGIAEALLAKGADAGATDRLGKNAMTYAAGEGRTDVVRLLLRHGVDPNAVYRNHLTALMWGGCRCSGDSASNSATNWSVRVDPNRRAPA